MEGGVAATLPLNNKATNDDGYGIGGIFNTLRQRQMRTIDNPVAIVTGAAQGLGKAIAKRLVDEVVKFL